MKKGKEDEFSPALAVTASHCCGGEGIGDRLAIVSVGQKHGFYVDGPNNPIVVSPRMGGL